MRGSAYAFATLLFSLAVLIRLGGVTVLRDWTMGPTHQHGADPVEYNLLALQLTKGEGYTWQDGQPTSFRPPGFPLFLAGMYRTFGVHYSLAYAMFCLLGGAGCVLTYLLARELLPEGGARTAGAFAAVYVPYVHMATFFASENLYIPCLTLGALLFIRSLKTDSWAPLAGAGLVLGWATLTRPYTLLLLPICLAVVALGQVRRGQLRVGPLAVLPATFLAVVLPWTARNYATFGHPVLVATNGGSTFYGGNNDRVLTEPALLGYWTLDGLPGRAEVLATPDEVSHDQMEWELGIHWVRDHLASLPRLYVYKLVRLSLPDVASHNPHYVWLQAVACSPFLLLALLGMAYCIRRADYWTPAWLTVHGNTVATLVTAVVFFGCPRYRDACVPFLMVYSVLGLTALSWVWGGLGFLTGVARSGPAPAPVGSDLDSTPYPPSPEQSVFRNASPSTQTASP